MNVEPIPNAVPENTTTSRRPLDSWEWDRFFQAAKSVLEERVESKGDTNVIYQVRTTPNMVDLAQQVCEELLKQSLTSIKNL
jgi:hypothetical protein